METAIYKYELYGLPLRQLSFSRRGDVEDRSRGKQERDALGATFGKQLESGASKEWTFLSSHHPQSQRIPMPDDGARAIDRAPVGDGRSGNLASLGDGVGETVG